MTSLLCCSVRQFEACCSGSNHQLDTSMLDVIYILATVAFFALMLLYVRACERLGRDTTDHTENTP